jgi:hypothetical protein
MNNEKSEAQEKNIDGDLPNDGIQKLRAFFTPDISYEYRKPKSDAGKETMTDWLIATYWG